MKKTRRKRMVSLNRSNRNESGLHRSFRHKDALSLPVEFEYVVSFPAQYRNRAQRRWEASADYRKQEKKRRKQGLL